MKRTEMNRREFHRLTAAAFGGLVAGTTIGCGGGDEGAGPADGGYGGGAPGEGGYSEPGAYAEDESGKPADQKGEPQGDKVAQDSPWGETHVCRGLNACKGLGRTGENACAGQGACATAAAHDCAGQNECKYQGGCGDNPGQNACKEMGQCAVPMEFQGEAWTKAREAFEAAMQEAGKDAGQPPAPGA